MKAENSPEFDCWAASFKREEAEFVVNMEYLVECGDELREEISVDEAREYAEPFLRKIGVYELRQTKTAALTARPSRSNFP